MNSYYDINIKNNIFANVDYKGMVTIKLYDSKSKLLNTVIQHNAALSGLFTCLARAVAGLSILNYTPSLIMGYYEDGTEALTQKIAYASTPLIYNSTAIENQLKESDSTDGDTVEFTFLIPVTNIVNKTKNITKLILFNKLNVGCAEIILDTPIKTNVASSILISWRLQFMDHNV